MKKQHKTDISSADTQLTSCNSSEVEGLRAVEEDERIWDQMFAATPDDVFDKMAKKVQEDIAAGQTWPLRGERKQRSQMVEGLAEV